MDAISYFVCFAAGIALDATYNRLRKVGEQKAYSKGYKQAKKEEEIKTDTQRQCERIQRVEELPMYGVDTVKPKRRIYTIPESFMDELQANGCAVTKFPRNGGTDNE